MSRTYRHKDLFKFKERIKNNNITCEDIEEIWGTFHKKEDKREFAKNQRKNSRLALREQIREIL